MIFRGKFTGQVTAHVYGEFTGRVYGSSLLVEFHFNLLSQVLRLGFTNRILRFVFYVRVYGRIYDFIVHVVFMVQVYWIRLQDEFTGQIFVPTLRVRFMSRSF